MTSPLTLGFVALTDAAPLIVARAFGYFESEKLDVTLRREVSWATIRDRVATGLYQGAHMLAPAVLAANVGAGSEPATLIAPLSLGAHGATIGVSQTLSDRMAELNPQAPTSAAALAQVVTERRTRALPPISFAVVFAYSMHNYMLRHWVASADLDPDRDIRIVVAAPTAVTARLQAGEIDGFCVGAPWPAACAAECGARILLDASTFWRGGPDKVLGLSAAWADAAPDAALALTRAVLRAALWADAPENAEALMRLLAQPEFVSAPAPLIAEKLKPKDPTRIRFARDHSAYPWRSHARWILTQMLRWGQIGSASDLGSAATAYRPDLYRVAARSLGIDAPVGETHDRLPLDDVPQGLGLDGESLRRDAARYAINRVQG